MGLAERLYRDRVRIAATADDPFRLFGDKVPPGEVWRIDRYTWELVTDQAGEARAFIDGRGYDHYLQQWLAPANGPLFVDEWPFMMGEGERFGLEITTLDSGDVILVHLTGVKLQVDPRTRQEEDEGSAHLEEMTAHLEEVGVP